MLCVIAVVAFAAFYVTVYHGFSFCGAGVQVQSSNLPAIATHPGLCLSVLGRAATVCGAGAGETSNDLAKSSTLRPMTCSDTARSAPRPPPTKLRKLSITR